VLAESPVQYDFVILLCRKNIFQDKGENTYLLMLNFSLLGFTKIDFLHFHSNENLKILHSKNISSTNENKMD